MSQLSNVRRGFRIIRRASGRVRFSLIGLLVFVTLVCLALAWFVQPKQVVATALFRVSTSRTSITANGRATEVDQQEFDLVKRTQLALIESHFVLQKAVRDPNVASLPILAGQPDPVAWLQKRLKVEFPQQAEILSITLSAREEFANDLVLLVDAVSKAYQEEVVYAEQQRTLSLRDLKAQSARKLREELSQKMQELDELRSETKDHPETVEQRMLELEIDVLTEQWRELSRDLEREDIDANSPSRIELIQPAVVGPAD